MATTVNARYENGALRPLEPLDLDEGREVKVTIEDQERRRAERWPPLSEADRAHPLRMCPIPIPPAAMR